MVMILDIVEYGILVDAQSSKQNSHAPKFLFDIIVSKNLSL